MQPHDDIIDFVAATTMRRRDRIDLEDVFIGNGIEGDDGDEFILGFGSHFGVNIDGFLDYFHYVGDEPPGYRRIFPVGTDGKEIPFMPVSIDVLAEAIALGRWPIQYPQHTIGESVRSRIMKAAIFPVVVAGVIYLLRSIASSFNQ